MRTLPPTLIARLRTRLRAVAWLFALLVLAKSAFALSCEIDGVAADAIPTVAATVDSDAGGDACWHAGAGGCHCACAHSATLAPSSACADVATVRDARPCARAVAMSPARPQPDLRPPIA